MIGRLSRAFLSASALSLLARSAAADERGRSDEPVRQTWYGWQTGLALLASDALFMAGSAAASHGNSQDASNALVTTGVVGHVLAGPVVHWTRGHYERGFASLGVIVGSGVLSAGLTGGLWAVANHCNPFDSQSSFGGGSGNCRTASFDLGILGLGLGVVIGNIIDLSVFSSDVPWHETGALRLAPVLSRDQFGLGIAGQF